MAPSIPRRTFLARLGGVLALLIPVRSPQPAANPACRLRLDVAAPTESEVRDLLDSIVMTFQDGPPPVLVLDTREMERKARRLFNLG